MVGNSYSRNGIRWLVNGIPPEVLSAICDAIHENTGEVIRNGYYKKVMRYTYHEDSFFIKQYTTRNFLEGVKSLFSLSKAHKEWICSHRLQRNQLLTAESVAMGEKRRFGVLKDCYIISKAIPNSITVKAFLSTIQQSSAPVSGKNRFLRDLVSYVKTVHDRGIFHGELHTENVLVDTDNPASFSLLDVGRACFKKDAPLSFRRNELSRLLYSIMDVCTHDEITGLIHTYTNQLLKSKDGEFFCKAVLKEIYKTKKRFWRSRTRKCLKTNNVFRVTTHDGYTIHMRNEWDVSTLASLIRKHMLFLNERSDMAVKLSAKTAITRVPVSHADMRSVCIKEYRYPSVWKRFFSFFRGSSARRAWVAAHGLMAAHFRTPQPIALFEEKRTGIIKKSFIIMEDISGCLPCNTYVSETFRDSFDKIASAKKRRFLACLALLLRQLSDSGIHHGDLKANNLMVRESQGTWDFFCLDLDRLSFYKEIPLKKKMKTLSQLNASLPHCITYTDRLRFYRLYSGMRGFTRADKRIVGEIIRLSILRNHVWNPKRSALK